MKDLNQLQYSTPEAEGISSAWILDFLHNMQKKDAEIHGLMIAVNNKVVFETYASPYARNIPHITHSFTKCMTNTAFGLAYSQGLVDIDDKVLKYFPQYEETANDYLKHLTIRNLLTMRSGQVRSIGGNEWRPLKTSWVDAYFQVGWDKEPGTKFMYSSGNSYIVSAIVQKVTGKTCDAYIKEHLSGKLGLSDFPWMKSPEGICSGGNGVNLCTDDILKIGLLYLNDGKWNGEQLISKDWVDLALGRKDPVERGEKEPEYNFHWRRKAEDAWSSRGMFGQTCCLVPGLNMVIAITAADRRYASGDLIQQCIIDKAKAARAEVDAKAAEANTAAESSAAVADESVVGAGNSAAVNDNAAKAGDSAVVDESVGRGGLAEKDEQAVKALRDYASRMTLEGRPMSQAEGIKAPFIARYEADGQIDYVTAVTVEVTEDEVLFTMKDDRGIHIVRNGLNCWKHGVTSMTGHYLHHQYEFEMAKISAMAYWTGENQLMLEWRYPEMAFFDHVTLEFMEDGSLKMSRWVNMNSQDTERPELICSPLK